MKTILRVLGLLLVAATLSTGLAAQSASAARYDATIQPKIAQQLTSKKEFRNVQASVEDGIVTLSGNVDLYQQKLDATEKVRKIENVQGVRNLIAVNSASAPDAALAAQLGRKL